MSVFKQSSCFYFFSSFKTIQVDAIRQKEIESLKKLAPLHNAIDAGIIKTARRIFPNTPVVGVFDTAFHRTIAPQAALYAIPQELSTEYSLRRYGFHGIAHEYVSKSLHKCLQVKEEGTRVITCHLGNGASICAIKDGKSFDTSMGLTPLEGLIMGTRSGDVDPGLVLYLIQECGMTPSKVEMTLNHESGLLGLSELSSDVRQLEVAAQQQNEKAIFALESFAYRVAKYVGSYVVVLGGVDALAFSGGIGENSPAMRNRIVKKLECLGFILDTEANEKKEFPLCITVKNSRIPAWVIHADENYQIASETYKAVQNFLFP